MAEQPTAPKSAILKIGGVAVVALAFGAGGTFLGNWAWQAYAQQQAAHKLAAQEASADAERKTPKGQQREAVRFKLNDPESAEFRAERVSKIYPEVWCGEVNAKNRMGAKVGYQRYFVAFNDQAGTANSASVSIDPPTTSSAVDRIMKEGFDSEWETYCK